MSFMSRHKDCLRADVIYFTGALNDLWASSSQSNDSSILSWSRSPPQSKRKWHSGRTKPVQGNKTPTHSFETENFPQSTGVDLALITSFSNNMRIENFWWDDIYSVGFSQMETNAAANLVFVSAIQKHSESSGNMLKANIQMQQKKIIHKGSYYLFSFVFWGLGGKKDLLC